MLKRCIGIICLSVVTACANQVELPSRSQSQELGVRQFKKHGDSEAAFYYCEHDPLDAWGCTAVTPKTAIEQTQNVVAPQPASLKQDRVENAEANTGRAQTAKERVRERVRRLQSGQNGARSRSGNDEDKNNSPAEDESLDESKLLTTVYFDFSRYELTDEAKALLDSVRNDETLNESRLLVIGYTDAVGRKQYNDNLARRRARAVADYLAEGNVIEPSALIANGYGLCCYIRDNDTDDGRKLNRRVEIRIQSPVREGN